MSVISEQNLATEDARMNLPTGKGTVDRDCLRADPAWLALRTQLTSEHRLHSEFACEKAWMA